MGKLKKAIKENLSEFVGFVFESKLDQVSGLAAIKDFLVNKRSRYSILQQWIKSYGKEFEMKKKSANSLISDFACQA